MNIFFHTLPHNTQTILFFCCLIVVMMMMMMIIIRVFYHIFKKQSNPSLSPTLSTNNEILYVIFIRKNRLYVIVDKGKVSSQMTSIGEEKKENERESFFLFYNRYIRHNFLMLLFSQSKTRSS
jgi:hypothetical protein